jgi:hypothetical protein
MHLPQHLEHAFRIHLPAHFGHLFADESSDRQIVLPCRVAGTGDVPKIVVRAQEIRGSCDLVEIPRLNLAHVVAKSPAQILRVAAAHQRIQEPSVDQASLVPGSIPVRRAG